MAGSDGPLARPGASCPTTRNGEAVGARPWYSPALPVRPRQAAGASRDPKRPDPLRNGLPERRPPRGPRAQLLSRDGRPGNQRLREEKRGLRRSNPDLCGLRRRVRALGRRPGVLRAEGVRLGPETMPQLPCQPAHHARCRRRIGARPRRATGGPREYFAASARAAATRPRCLSSRTRTGRSTARTASGTSTPRAPDGGNPRQRESGGRLPATAALILREEATSSLPSNPCRRRSTSSRHRPRRRARRCTA